MGGAMDRTERIEERLAHLILALEDLSDQMRAQWDRIGQLERQVARLEAQLAAGAEEDGAGGLRIGG